MLKITIYLLLALAIIGGAIGAFHLYRVSQRNAAEMAQYEGQTIKARPFAGKTLIIYYSLSGHTKDIAAKIQKMTGGDMYEIKTVDKLNTVPWFYLILRQQLKDKKYPALSGELPDLSRYDTIFVGSPVWWYTVSTPMLTDVVFLATS